MFNFYFKIQFEILCAAGKICLNIINSQLIKAVGDAAIGIDKFVTVVRPSLKIQIIRIFLRVKQMMMTQMMLADDTDSSGTGDNKISKSSSLKDISDE